MVKSMADVRREYGTLSLDVANVDNDPFVVFNTWLEQILETDNYDPTAMVLSTCDDSGFPDSRVVLLKFIEDGNFVFFTNYTSTKAKQIENNIHVCLNFFWPFMARQVRIKGLATKLSPEKNNDYFSSRPRLSQIAAYASEQSQEIASREYLEDKMNALIEKFGSEPIICPDNWGGYAVLPIEIEFWQGRDNRLHDRLLFTKSENNWNVSVLSP